MDSCFVLVVESGYDRDRKCSKEVKSVRKREVVGRRVRVEGSRRRRM